MCYNKILQWHKMVVRWHNTARNISFPAFCVFHNIVYTTTFVVLDVEIELSKNVCDIKNYTRHSSPLSLSLSLSLLAHTHPVLAKLLNENIHSTVDLNLNNVNKKLWRSLNLHFIRKKVHLHFCTSASAGSWKPRM